MIHFTEIILQENVSKSWSLTRMHHLYNKQKTNKKLFNYLHRVAKNKTLHYLIIYKELQKTKHDRHWSCHFQLQIVKKNIIQCIYRHTNWEFIGAWSRHYVIKITIHYFLLNIFFFFENFWSVSVLECLRCGEFKNMYECSLKHVLMQISMKHFMTKIVFNKIQLRIRALVFKNVDISHFK